MNVNTRSKSISISTIVQGETVKKTKDPLQVTFATEKIKLGIWRYVIYNRYCGQHRPKDTTFSIKETQLNDQKELFIAFTFGNKIPDDLYHTCLKLFYVNKKLLTIHIYHTTGKILVQGHVCKQWVYEDFERLKEVVNQLYVTSDIENVAWNGLPLTGLTSAFGDCDTQVPSSSVMPLATRLDTEDTAVESDPSLTSHLTTSSISTPPSLSSPSVKPQSLINLPVPVSSLGASSAITRVQEEGVRQNDSTNADIGTDTSTDRDVAVSTLAASSSSTSVKNTPFMDSSSSEVPQDVSFSANSSSLKFTPDKLACEVKQVTTTPNRSKRKRSLSLNLTKYSNTDTHLQQTINSACKTIVNMQQEINGLKSQLAKATDEINRIHQNHEDSETRLKNTIKGLKQEFTQQIQEISNEQTNLKTQIKDTGNKVQSVKDTQTTVKRQLHALNNTNRHTQNSQCDTKNNNTVSQQEKNKYTVDTSNSYSVLSDLHEVTVNQQSHKISTDLSREKNIQATHSSARTITHTPSHSANQSRNTIETPQTNEQTYSQQSTPTHPLITLKSCKIPRDCQMLMIGDSMLQGMTEHISTLDINMHLDIISVPGIRISHLCQWLTSLPPSPHIQEVTIVAGIDSCQDGPISDSDWGKMILALKQAFPAANIKMSSLVPPFGRHILNEPASLSTRSLRYVCEKEEVSFINNTPSFLTKAGAPKKIMYVSRLYPSKLGYKIMISNLCPQLLERRVSQPDRVPSKKAPLYDYDNDFPQTPQRSPHAEEVCKALGRYQRHVPEPNPLPPSQSQFAHYQSLSTQPLKKPTPLPPHRHPAYMHPHRPHSHSTVTDNQGQYVPLSPHRYTNNSYSHPSPSHSNNNQIQNVPIPSHRYQNNSYTHPPQSSSTDSHMQNVPLTPNRQSTYRHPHPLNSSSTENRLQNMTKRVHPHFLQFNSGLNPFAVQLLNGLTAQLMQTQDYL